MNRILRFCQGVLVIPFFCISISVVGISCDEQPRILTSTPEKVQPETEFEKIYDMVSEGNYYPGQVTSLVMIANSIDRLADAIKEHECLSK